MDKSFARSAARQRLRICLRGLLSPAGRKNNWQLAEAVGDDTPYGIQHLLGRAVCSVDHVCDDLLCYVREHLADVKGILVIDATSFLKTVDKAWEWRASTAVPPGALRTARSESLLRTLAPVTAEHERLSTVRSTCLKHGQRIWSAAVRPEFLMRWALPRSLKYPGNWLQAHSTQDCRVLGAWPTVPTEMIPPCGAGWKSAVSLMYSA